MPSRGVVLEVRKDGEDLKALYTLANQAPFEFAEPKEYRLEVRDSDGFPSFKLGTKGDTKFFLKESKLYGERPKADATLEKTVP